MPKKPAKIDKKTGEVITKEHHTYRSGAVDRGNPDSPFEVSSINARTGEHMTTFHKTPEQAHKAILGRRSRHENIIVTNHSK